MIIKSALYDASYPGVQKMPEGTHSEFAFVGRSNVGKSSLINMLLDRKSLAKTSRNPGKTQMINRFIVNELWYLVDLPGYGYAKLSKKHRGSLRKMINTYLLNRTSLINTFILLDARHSLQKNDEDLLLWAGENHLAFSIVFTKTDKLKPNQLNKNIHQIMSVLSRYWDPLPPRFISSSINKTGREEILSYINQVK